MKRLLFVWGTRPEDIKMCPLFLEVQKRGKQKAILCMTGQHRMAREVTDFFGITPDFDLQLMKEGQTLFDVTERVLCGMQSVFSASCPDLVLVHGDTATAFAAALAAFYERIPVAHVEAGLRTYDLTGPFPEEWNRRAVDMLASLHFAPTDKSAGNLLAEGSAPDRVFVTGNTAVDALRYSLARPLKEPLPYTGDRRLILLTAHRRESIGKPLGDMLRGVRELTEQTHDVEVLYPLHPNPTVQEIAHTILDGCPQVRMVPPLSMHTFHHALARSYLVLTDSGGVQEEAAALGIPTLVLRNETERPEGVQAGILQTVGTDADAILREGLRLLEDPAAYAAMKGAQNVYGDGHAAEIMADILECL